MRPATAFACALFIPAVLAAQDSFVVPHRLEAAQLQRLLDSVRKKAELLALGAAVFTKDSILGLDVVGVRRSGDPGHRGRPVSHRVRREGDDGRTPRSAGRSWKVRWIVRQPPATPRGSFSYSNSNYIIAGAIAEPLFNSDYEHLLIDELLAPLGIATAGFGAPGSADVMDQPRGHRLGFLGIHHTVAPGPKADSPPLYSPAGRLHLSLPDWVRWCQAVIRAARGEPSPW